MLWGETEYYKDFLLKKYEPVVMTKTLCFEFNEDAATRVKNTKFGIYEKDEQGMFHPVKGDIVVYKNGSVCAGSEFTISPKDKEVQLGIEFTPEAREGVHKWFLKVLDNGGLDRINEFSMEEEMLPLLLEWKAEKVEKMNPLRFGIDIFLLIVLVVLLIWLLFVKPQLYPTFKVKRLYILCDGKQIPVSLSGAREVVCSNRTCSQGIINRWMTGKVVYIKDHFWQPGDVVILPKDRHSIKVRLTAKYHMMPNIVTNRQPVEIRHTALKTNVVIFKIQ